MAFANTINREIIYHPGGFDDNPRRKNYAKRLHPDCSDHHSVCADPAGLIHGRHPAACAYRNPETNLHKYGCTDQYIDEYPHLDP